MRRSTLDRVDKRPSPEPCRGEVEETQEGQGGPVVVDPAEHPLCKKRASLSGRVR